jgi:hypothetical protein
MGEHAVHQRREQQTMWAGTIRFAAAMMIMVGGFSIIEGLIALLQNEYYLTTAEGMLVLDLTGWGWLHLGMGAVAVGIGFGLFNGAKWARIAGVVFACLNVIVQLAFLMAHPLGATVVIAVDIVIIWALMVHGGELEQDW